MKLLEGTMEERDIIDSKFKRIKAIAEMCLLRELSEEEKETYREWVADNWVPLMFMNPMWHPFVRDEWIKFDNIYARKSKTCKK